LFSQPGVTAIVGKPLRRDRMAWTVNFHNQPTFEADKIKDALPSRKYLPLYVAEFEFRYNNRATPTSFGAAIGRC